MPDYLNPFIPSGNKRSYILKQTCSFYMQVCLSMYDLWLPPGTKELRELNICETKNFEIKVVIWTSKTEKNVERLRMSRFLFHLLIYLRTLFYFGIKSRKIEHTFKTND